MAKVTRYEVRDWADAISEKTRPQGCIERRTRMGHLFDTRQEAAAFIIARATSKLAVAKQQVKHAEARLRNVRRKFEAEAAE